MTQVALCLLKKAIATEDDGEPIKIADWGNLYRNATRQSKRATGGMCWTWDSSSRGSTMRLIGTMCYLSIIRKA